MKNNLFGNFLLICITKLAVAVYLPNYQLADHNAINDFFKKQYSIASSRKDWNSKLHCTLYYGMPHTDKLIQQLNAEETLKLSGNDSIGSFACTFNKESTAQRFGSIDFAQQIPVKSHVIVLQIKVHPTRSKNFTSNNWRIHGAILMDQFKKFLIHKSVQKAIVRVNDDSLVTLYSSVGFAKIEPSTHGQPAQMVFELHRYLPQQLSLRSLTNNGPQLPDVITEHSTTISRTSLVIEVHTPTMFPVGYIFCEEIDLRSEKLGCKKFFYKPYDAKTDGDAVAQKIWRDDGMEVTEYRPAKKHENGKFYATFRGEPFGELEYEEDTVRKNTIKIVKLKMYLVDTDDSMTNKLLEVFEKSKIAKGKKVTIFEINKNMVKYLEKYQYTKEEKDPSILCKQL